MRRFDKLVRVLATRVSIAAIAVGASIAIADALIAHTAFAQTNYESLYGFDRTWNAAFRMIRVDMGFKVTEKDDSTGYLLFEYKSAEGGKVSAGSMEFVRSKEPDAPVRVIVQLASMPHYHEQMIVDALARKLRAEYGDPPAPRERRENPPPVDAGTEAEP